jgi:hypothetical protein
MDDYDEIYNCNDLNIVLLKKLTSFDSLFLWGLKYMVKKIVVRTRPFLSYTLKDFHPNRFCCYFKSICSNFDKVINCFTLFCLHLALIVPTWVDMGHMWVGSFSRNIFKLGAQWA